MPPSSVSDSGPDLSPRIYWLGLFGVVVVFLALRLPIMYRLVTQVDEDIYAVPGLTILKTGLPQVPYTPSRVPESVFFRADRVMFSMPPAYFYAQALFYALLPDSLATARLHSACWGIAILLLTAELARRITGSRLGGWCTACLLCSHRLFYDFATRARPDVMCAALALLVCHSVLNWQSSRTRGQLIRIGALLGLCGLTHPLALPIAIQIGMWIFAHSQGWRRLGNPLIVAAVSIAVFCLWLPLIAIDFEAFRHVTHNQYGFSNSHAFPYRLVNPTRYLAYHLGYLVETAGSVKILLTIWPLIGWTAFCMYSNRWNMRTVAMLSWSSFYLIATCSGDSHNTWGYFIFPVSLLMICAGMAVAAVAKWLLTRGVLGGIALAGFAAALLPVLASDSQVKITWQFVKNWNRIEYNAPRFAKMLMDDIPPDALCTVDTEYVLDFYLAGRPVLDAIWFPFFFNSDSYPYDYYVASRFAERSHLTPLMCGELIKQTGDRSENYTCYADVYRPSSQPCEVIEYPYPDWLKTPRTIPYWRRMQAEQQAPAPAPTPLKRSAE